MPIALELASREAFGVEGPLIVKESLFGIKNFNLTESVIVQWIVMAILIVVLLVITHNMQVIPQTKRQAAAEMLYNFFHNTVKDTMGGKYVGGYQSYIAALCCFILINNLMGLLGLRNPTADVSVTGAFAIITFCLVQFNKGKTGKFKGYMKSFIEPMPFMLPFNIIGEFANPLALTLRLFGNMTAGLVIDGLIYYALHYAALVVPAVTSLYFDIFSAVMQAYIFVMLSMSYIVSADCSED